MSERAEMLCAHPELSMLAAGVLDKRTKQLPFLQCADDCGDHIHELELLALHVFREQGSGIGSELEKSLVEHIHEFAADGPDVVETMADKIGLLGSHDAALLR
jgi:hypothetical protein